MGGFLYFNMLLLDMCVAHFIFHPTYSPWISFCPTVTFEWMQELVVGLVRKFAKTFKNTTSLLLPRPKKKCNSMDMGTSFFRYECCNIWKFGAKASRFVCFLIAKQKLPFYNLHPPPPNVFSKIVKGRVGGNKSSVLSCSPLKEGGAGQPKLCNEIQWNFFWMIWKCIFF